MAELLRRSALQLLEDNEDIQEGLKSLSEEEGTIIWEQYRLSRQER